MTNRKHANETSLETAGLRLTWFDHRIRQLAVVLSLKLSIYPAIRENVITLHDGQAGTILDGGTPDGSALEESLRSSGSLLFRWEHFTHIDLEDN